MSDRIDPLAVLDLQRLAADYWARADGDLEQSIEALFTEDARLVVGSLELHGRSAIDKFFRERDATQQSAQRTTRHIACNHRMTDAGEGRVLVRSTVLVYVGIGTLPLPSAAPAGIADFEDLCERDASGRWRFARRTGSTVFVGAGAASFAR